MHCPPRRRSPRGAVSLSRLESQFLPSLAVCSVPRSEGSCSLQTCRLGGQRRTGLFQDVRTWRIREFYREMVDDMCMG